MKTQLLLSLPFLSLALVPSAAWSQNQTTDFPKGADWTAVTRPNASIIAAASHTDYDEFAVPMGRFDGSKFAKTVTATGSVNHLAYSGPPSTSTLQNLAQISAQLASEGYKPIFSCIREACGGYQFVQALAMPLVNTLDGTGYHNLAVETFGAVTGDVRYTAFQRGTEYLTVMAALAPGKYSALLLIDVGGKVTVATDQPTPAPSASPQTTSGADAPTPAATPASVHPIRGRLRSLIIPKP